MKIKFALIGEGGHNQNSNRRPAVLIFAAIGRISRKIFAIRDFSSYNPRMLYIMRHGQTDWNLVSRATGAENIPLNDTGRAQARDAAEIVVPFGITRIFASDLVRAAETADIIGRRLRISVEYDPRLREWDFGKIKGMKEIGLNPVSFKKLLSENQNSGMEPIKDVFVRIGSFLGELDMNQNTLIVSHGGLMRAMMYHIKTNGKEDNDKFLEFSFATQIENAQIFKLQSCGTFELVR